MSYIECTLYITKNKNRYPLKNTTASNLFSHIKFSRPTTIPIIMSSSIILIIHHKFTKTSSDFFEQYLVIRMNLIYRKQTEEKRRSVIAPYKADNLRRYWNTHN